MRTGTLLRMIDSTPITREEETPSSILLGIVCLPVCLFIVVSAGFIKYLLFSISLYVLCLVEHIDVRKTNQS